MNERIEKLAGQAKFMAEEDINRQISYNTELKAFAEKFAELIVRECAGEVLCQLYDCYPSSNEQFNLGHEAGLKLAVSKIKQHFGVEL